MQGDTTTAMAAALAAFHRRVRVGHVEAGLRTGDFDHPFPEEMNRRVVDLVSDANFVPTRRAARALEAEDVPAEKIFLTGNTVVDALAGDRRPREGRHAGGGPRPHHRAPPRELRRTARAGRAGDRAARRTVSGDAVRPRHPSQPQRPGPSSAATRRFPNVELVEPLDYLALVRLMRRARLILTDSGGIQEEAPTFGKPVLVLREKTERPEGVEAGLAALVGTDEEAIVGEAAALLSDGAARRRMTGSESLRRRARRRPDRRDPDGTPVRAVRAARHESLGSHEGRLGIGPARPDLRARPAADRRSSWRRALRRRVRVRAPARPPQARRSSSRGCRSRSRPRRGRAAKTSSSFPSSPGATGGSGRSSSPRPCAPRPTRLLRLARGHAASPRSPSAPAPGVTLLPIEGVRAGRTLPTAPATASRSRERSSRSAAARERLRARPGGVLLVESPFWAPLAAAPAGALRLADRLRLPRRARGLRDQPRRALWPTRNGTSRAAPTSSSRRRRPSGAA